MEERIKTEAREAGFALAGIAAATDADHFDRFAEWLDGGRAGEMAYLGEHREARRNPRSILAGVRSVVMLGMTYSNLPNPPPAANRGRVARYAQGPDYHRFLWDKLDLLLGRLRECDPALEGRGVVDTAPLLERDFGRRAGLGWFGKNTMLIDRAKGSYFVLAALLLNAELTADRPHAPSHCGTCTRCIDACPTGAITAPGELDARRCISYHTIELRGPIPHEFRPQIGDWLFGCDICQEVCPWNRKVLSGNLPRDPELETLDACEVLRMGEDQFRARFRGTAITRTKWNGLRRNAAIVLGNSGDTAALAALRDSVDVEDGTVREAVLWAIERLEMREARAG